MRRRVAHVDTERGWRGGQVQLEAFLRRSSENLEHHLLVPLGSPWVQRAPEGVVVHRLPLWGRYVGVWDLARRLAALQPAAVGIHTAHALALTPTRWRRIVHRRVDFQPSHRALGRMGSAARVLAVSEAVASILRQGGVTRVRVIYDGVPHDVPLLDAPTAPRLLAVGALVPHKDHATLLRAMTELDVPLDIAGDGPLRPRLQRRIRRLGLEGRVRLLGQVDDVPARLVAATALVHPSKEEGLGQSVLEALAHGVPVVATRAGGLPEAVGRDGRLVPQQDPGALADALRDALVDPAARARLAEVRAERARRFSVDAMVTATEAAYREVVG